MAFRFLAYSPNKFNFTLCRTFKLERRLIFYWIKMRVQKHEKKAIQTDTHFDLWHFVPQVHVHRVKDTQRTRQKKTKTLDRCEKCCPSWSHPIYFCIYCECVVLFFFVHLLSFDVFSCKVWITLKNEYSQCNSTLPPRWHHGSMICIRCFFVFSAGRLLMRSNSIKQSSVFRGEQTKSTFTSSASCIPNVDDRCIQC